MFELLIFGINAGGISIKKIKKEGKNHEKMEAALIDIIDQFCE